jgi:hypothetical protein
VTSGAFSTVWDGLSSSVQRTFGWAQAVTPEGADVGVDGLIAGMLRTHPGSSEPDALLNRAGRPVTDVFAASGLAAASLAPVPLTELPGLTEDARRAYEDAAALASKYDAFGDRRVHMPHLFGGLLTVGAGSAYATVVGDAWSAAASEYPRYLDQLMRRDSLQYGEFLAQDLPTPGAPAPPQPFIGRRRELETIKELVGNGRPALITGPRGVGKTALALRAATELAPDGYVYATDPLNAPRESLVVLDAGRRVAFDEALSLYQRLIFVSESFPDGGDHGMLVELPPLAADEVQALLRARVQASISDDDLARLVPLTQGFPALAVAAAGVLAGDQDVASILRRAARLEKPRVAEAGAELPELVRSQLDAAFADLPPVEREVLRVVSLMDDPFSTAQAATAVGIAPGQAGAALAALVRGHFAIANDDHHWSLRATARTYAQAIAIDEPEERRVAALLQALAAQHSTPPEADETPALAGFQSDEPARRDRIGFDTDVVALSSLLIAHEVQPPLSVGLFGDWGTGKSTFMRLMRDQVRQLQADWTARDDSPFCRSVKQITFNAWNYSDANLWAGLVTKIFEGLAAADPEIERDTALGDEQRAALVNVLETAKLTVEEKRAELEDANQRESTLTRRLTDVSTKAATKSAELGAVSPAKAIAAARDSEAVKDLRDTVLEEAGTPGGTAEQAVTIAREVQTTWGFVVHAARLLGRKAVLVLIAVTVALAVVVGVAEHFDVPVAGTVAGIVGWLSTFLALVRTPVHHARQVAQAGSELLAGVQAEAQATIRREEAELQRELSELSALRAQLVSELQAARSAAEQAQRDIDDIQSGRRLTQFVQERAASAEYREYLGLIALIRRDFDQLTELLLENTEEADKPPFDRIILYIDDLDRCRAELVVQVLEAVHLLLALRLFVVVVGVDPRWLAESLKHHYIGQLGLDDSGAGQWATTPQNYLEKIFQIPFALKRMKTTGFTALMGDLFAVRSTEPSAPKRPVAPPPTPQAHEAQDSATLEERPVVTVGETAFIPPEEARQVLRVWPAELAFITRLGDLVPTPRAAKRLANTYRLIRVTQAGTKPATFVQREGKAGEYRTALILLAIVVGFSEISATVFNRLLDSPQASFWDFVEALRPEKDANERTVEAYSRLREGLQALQAKDPPSDDIRTYQNWAPEIARYSFETARVAVAA